MAIEKILVVDDEEAICRICQHEARRFGIPCEYTTSPIEALKIIRSSPVDLLITDIKMPEMSGLQLMEQARQAAPGLAVIMITAYPSLEVTMEALKQGATSFIRKPFDLSEFRFTLQNVLEKERLIEENLRLKSLVNLLDVSETINSIHDPQKLYAQVMAAAIRETGATRGKIYYLEKDSHRLILEYEFEPQELLPAPHDGSTPDHDGQDFTEAVLADSETDDDGLPSVLALPLQTRNKLKGLLSLVKDQGQGFSQVQTDIAKILASQTAIALDNSELLHEREMLFLETIKSLASTLDEKDPYTHGHSQRVSNLAVEIGRRLQLPKEQLNVLSWAGSLHDLGKIGIPDRILQKPGRLTEEEFEIIRKHPEKGARILSHIPRLKPVREAVYTHHERYDGTGYPRGLQGDEIPLAGAIVSIADTLDAITTHRPYRGKRPLDDAYAVLAESSGTQFDPRLVATVLQAPLKSLTG